MIEALFFVAGSIFGAVVVASVEQYMLKTWQKETIALPQGMKRDSIDAQIKAVWNQNQQPAKEQGAVIMPERDVTNKDLKIDDLLQ
jgi:hypothetical protein